MFISNVDAGVEQMLRDRLPLPNDVGDISFDPPTGTWAAQLSRITVSFFLYEVRRSTQPSRSATRMAPEDGPRMRRRPQPMVELAYLVSGWAGSARDEHQLMGEVVSLLAATDIVPATYFPAETPTSVQLHLGDERHSVREVWAGLGGSLKASTTVILTVGADAFDWEQEAPQVTSISAMAERMTDRVAEQANGRGLRPLGR